MGAVDSAGEVLGAADLTGRAEAVSAALEEEISAEGILAEAEIAAQPGLPPTFALPQSQTNGAIPWS